MDQLIRQQFPYFKSGTFIYLDNAATTQVHANVIKAVADTLAYRGNPYRGAHALAKANQKKLEIAKFKIADFISASADEIVLTNNTTDSINLAVLALSDLIMTDDEILVAKGEHNSNLLPYLKLQHQGAKLKHFALVDYGYDLVDLKKQLSKKTKIVALQHCSNVTGVIQPIGEAIKIIKDYNPKIIVLVDGAQAVAHVPVNVKDLHCDVYAFSSHKMYGPDGIGVLYIKADLHNYLLPSKPGGGTVSNIIFSTDMAGDYVTPEYKLGLAKLAGGTPNLSGAVGLQKAIGMFKRIGWPTIMEHEAVLKNRLMVALEQISQVKVIKPLGQTIGVVAFTLVDETLNLSLSQYLNKNKVAIRFGSHCAFGLTEILGQETLRVSFAVYNTVEEVDRLVELIKQFVADNNQANPRLVTIKDIKYLTKELRVNSFSQIQGYIKQLAVGDDVNIVVMAGHFLGVPDFEHNTFYPSIKPILPEALHDHLAEFGMSYFPLNTWELGNALVSELKHKNKTAKLMIVANDTTGINELRFSSANITNKSAEDYRGEILQKFSGHQGLPATYLQTMADYGNQLSDLVSAQDNELCFRESTLRDHFQKFIRNNKNYFHGLIDYTMNKQEELDITINVLDNPEIKTCTFDSFNSKTGGKFCIAEVTQLLAELFGKSTKVNYDHLSNRVLQPKSQTDKNIFVIFSPAMCNNAVNRAAELYIKTFLQNNNDKEFHFVNIPLGPDSLKHLEAGVTMTHISNVQ